MQEVKNEGYLVNICGNETTALVPKHIGSEQHKFVLDIKCELMPENPCPSKVHNYYWQLLMVLMQMFGTTDCKDKLVEGKSSMKETDLINCLYGSILRLYNLFTELPKTFHCLQAES